LNSFVADPYGRFVAVAGIIPPGCHCCFGAIFIQEFSHTGSFFQLYELSGTFQSSIINSFKGEES